MKTKPADMQQLKNIAKSGLGVLLAVMVALGDALLSTCMRLTRMRGLQDFQSIFWNQVASMIFVLLLVAAVRPRLSGTSWKQIGGLVVGAILRVAATVCVCLSLLHALPGNTWAVVYGLSPALTLGLSSVLANEQPNAVQIGGIAVCTAGVTMVGVSMNRREHHKQTVEQQVLTLLYPIAACILFTVAWVLLRWLSKEGVPLVIHMFYYSMSGILLLPLAYMVKTPEWRFPAGVWGLLVAQTLAYAMQFLSNSAAIHNETIVTVQILKVLAVPMTFVLGYCVLGLEPTVLEMCGGAVTTVGVTAVGLWAWRLNLMEERHTQLMATLGFPTNK